jgi:hypothetical protein
LLERHNIPPSFFLQLVKYNPIYNRHQPASSLYKNRNEKIKNFISVLGSQSYRNLFQNTQCCTLEAGIETGASDFFLMELEPIK